MAYGPPQALGPAPGTVEVGYIGSGLACVELRGEHDLNSEAVLKPALAEAVAHSSVLVDLSDCAFIDSMVVLWLIQAARTVQARAERLMLVIPDAQTEVARVAKLINLSEVMPIYPSRQAALSHSDRPSAGPRS
jgi:anti-anti-sigma factor